MTSYKHTQVGYLTIIATFLVVILFVWIHAIASREVLSVDSGPNFLITTIMFLIVTLMASFSTLTVSVDSEYLKIKFGFGIFSKKFLLKQIKSVKMVKNKWYYGWGIRLHLFPYMWIYNVSGFEAIEIVLENGKIYRIGTDESEKLVFVINKYI